MRSSNLCAWGGTTLKSKVLNEKVNCGGGGGGRGTRLKSKVLNEKVNIRGGM